MQEQKITLTTQETADLLGVSRTYLYKLMDKGELTPLPQDTDVQFPRLNFDRAAVEMLKAKRDKQERKHRKRRTPPIQPHRAA